VITMGETIEHKCPNCGGSLVFDASSQMVKCPYCDSEFEAETFKKADSDLKDDIASDGGEEWSEMELHGISEYQCQSCGGNIYSDENTSATLCPYCGSAVILKGRLSGVLKPDKVIPFQQTKEQALKGLEEHCGGKRFVPKKFLTDNKLEEVKGLYVPFWIYDAELKGRVVYEGLKERTWTVNKTEYVETKHYEVVRGGDIAFDNVPGDGSSKMPDDLMESIEPFDHSKAVNFTTSYLSGYVADKYDLDQDAIRPRVRKRLANSTADEFMTTIYGYDSVSVRDVDIKTTKSDVDYVLYPVWLMTTEWEGKRFAFAMNGQTGKMVGNLPMDKLKLGAATGAVFALMLIVGSLIIGLGFDDFTGGVTFGLIEGIIACAVFYSYYAGQLKSVEFQHGASSYYREGSMNIEESSDVFLYKETRTR